VDSTDQSFTIRASSFGELFDCAMRWEAKHLLGMRQPSSPRAAIGTAFHAGTGAFDKARVLGETFRPADAADVVIAALDEAEAEGIDWNADPDFRRSTAERTALAMTARYCVEVSPRYTFIAVELPTKPLSIDCGDGIVITLTGTMDRARIRAGATGVGISDLKSGARAISQGRAVVSKHRPQLGTYELLYQHSTGITPTLPAEIIAASTAPGGGFASGETLNPARLLTGDGQTPGLIEHAAAMFRSGLFPPNPSSSLCGPRYCPRWSTCPYRSGE